MAEHEITSRAVDELGEKLDKFGEELSAQDRAILLGLFGVASTTLRRSIEGLSHASGLSDELDRMGAEPRRVARVAPGVELPSLSAGFAEAFSPGVAGRFAIGDSPLADSVGVSVGGVCVSVSWSKDIAATVETGEAEI